MAALATTGLLSGNDLDLLAHAFVASRRQVYWACPDDWFDRPAIVIDLDADAEVALEGAELTDNDEPAAVVARTVSAGVRRWAAAHLVRETPSLWAQLRTRARDLGGADGGGVLRGVLDAVDTLPAAAARLLRDDALRSGRGDVRLAALQILADEDLDAGQALAAADSHQEVRQWGARLRAPRTDGGRNEKAFAHHHELETADALADVQGSLF